jgi:methylsterol monooxygenase
MHHKYTAPEAVCGLYTHPLEHLIINSGSMMVGTIICASHPFTFAVWSLLALKTVAATHSGYRGFNGEKHDYHHEQFSKNFGIVFYLFDRLFGSFVKEDAPPQGEVWEKLSEWKLAVAMLTEADVHVDEGRSKVL